MKRILYYFTSLSKQLFIIAVAAFFAMRCGVFFASGYYKDSYVLLSILMYLIIFLACAFCFVAWKYFYTDFDSTRVVHTNGLLRRSQEAELAKVKRVEFTKKGIFLYYEEERLALRIPFYRFGIISSIGVQSFERMLEEEHIPMTKQYKVLPGYTAVSRFLGGFYAVLAVLLFFNAGTYAILLYLILTSGK